ncbi:hypothetical protein ACHQM5_027995 [Ranunculus cassubicifolius]
MRDPPLFIILLFFAIVSHGDDTSVMQELSKSISPTPSGWTGPDPCKWTSVRCDNNNRVTSIDLSSSSLSGTLPSDLNQLNHLSKLALQRNQFSGPLPSFANLSNLEELLLDNNLFSSIPSNCFGGLASLKTLSLSLNTKLSPWNFPNELIDSENLVELDASNVSFTGEIPDIFAKFISLQSVRLSYNNLTGDLPVSLSQTSVQNLWLNNQVNGLSGGIDLLGKLPGLAQVWLQKNAFTGSIPDLSNCTQLFDLQLRDNQFTGIVPPSLTSLKSLLNVTLANNKFQGPYPEFGGNVKADIAPINNFCKSDPGPCDPQVTALLEIAGAMGYPENLAESWKGNDACNDWNFVTCDTQKKSVTIINFGKQGFKGVISPAYANLTSLSKLLLNDNDLSGGVPDSLLGLAQLELLDVSNNNLTGTAPKFPQKVKFKTDGNKLGTNKGKDGGGGSGSGPPGTSSGGRGSTPDKSKGMSTGIIVVIVLAAVVVLAIVVCFVACKFRNRKQQMKFGRVPDTASNGKEMVSNASTSGYMNGLGGGGNELVSQGSDASDIQLFQGGNVAISIQVLRQVTNNFSHENILGRGGFGIVYKGVLHDGTQIAVKRMESAVMSSKGLGEFQAEIAVLTKVRHRHLVALLGFCTTDNERLLVYEYMPQGTLGQHLFDPTEHGYSPLTWKQRVTIALDVARGVEYLHTLAHESFIHRDLKASNILLGDDMRAKVSDFGLVKIAPQGGEQSMVTRLAGTFGYLAPEYAVTGKVSTKVDVYAFGAVLMELVTGRPALDERKPDDESHLVTWFRRAMVSKNNIRKAIDPELQQDDETFISISKVIELAGHCTSRDPGQRPDMGHAVNVLGPLVEQWTPAEEQQEDDLRIDLHLTLPEALQRWQSSEGSSTMDFGGSSMTFGSIPPNDGNTFRSSDGR